MSRLSLPYPRAPLGAQSPAGPVPMTGVVFECSSVGFSCEWALRAPSASEVVQRMADHIRCAHEMKELTPELRARVEAAVRPA